MVYGHDQEWKEAENYGRRSLSETTNSRIIASFGDRLRTRLRTTTNVETRVKARLLNLWRATEIELSGGYISFEAR